MVTSPPYWGVRDYGALRQIGMEPRIDSYVENVVATFDQVRRVLRDDGTVWLNMGDVYASGNRRYRADDGKYAARAMPTRPRTPVGLKPKDLVGVPWRLAFALQRAGWYLRTDIVWHKTNALPESVADRPWRSHEYLFLFSKNKHYRFSSRKLLATAPTLRRSVWSMASGRSRINGHSAVFPESLVSPCINASTKKGDIVLDPFCGTGTVARVCAGSGRRFVGIEINPEYVRAAARQLRALVASRFKQ